jgi:geranylgeranyl diphosphate synthase, type I
MSSTAERSAASVGAQHAQAAAAPVDLAVIRAAVERRLFRFIEQQSASACDGRLPVVATGTLARFLAGGKRLRPVLCVLGHMAAAGVLDEPVAMVGASLEMFHAFALIHDDVMDGADTRRGAPSVHRALAAHYRSLAARRADVQRRTAAGSMGVSGAILLGDLALAWSDAMLNDAGLTGAQSAAVRAIVDRMRVEVLYGQWLDVHTLMRPQSDIAAPLSVARYKTAKYTFERPLHIGAVLADVGPGLLEVLSRYALPLGEAFQLRDDLLGVYGDPAVTGKPVGDDLRAGRRTVLLATAFARADPVQRRALNGVVGDARLDASGLARARALFTDTGAAAEIERMISDRRARALAAARDAAIPPPIAQALVGIAHSATTRSA